MFLKKGKKNLVLMSMLMVMMVCAVVPAYADVPSTSYPSVTYGSTQWFDYLPLPYVDPVGQWTQTAYDYRYDGWDSDTFHALNAQANVSLSATSTSTYTLSGSTEFNFAQVAKATISGSWGQSWGKTCTVSYNAQAGYTYNLWSANEIKRTSWIYPYKDMFGKITYYNAKSNGKYGTVKWFFAQYTGY